MALSSKLQDNALIVMDRLDLEVVKTKRFAQMLSALKMKEALIITDGRNENAELSARNLPNTKVLRSEGLNVYDILKFKNVILVQPAVDKIQQRLLS